MQTKPTESLMAREPAKAKTETLTIRLDPKTRFILEFMSRLKGQTITTVVERAIVSAASELKIQAPDDYNHEIGWQDLWDVSEGVRALGIYAISDFFPTFEEERRLAFARTHWPFFFATKSKTIPLSHYIDILWPRIDEFIQFHEDNKAAGGDWHAAGKAMQDALAKANLKVPDWPPKEPAKTDVSKAAGKDVPSFSRDMDEDIPF
jgi:hypothetical protein